MFDSDSLALYKYCKENSFSIEHESKRDWKSTIGADVTLTEKKTDAFALRNCAGTALCDPIIVTKVPTPKAYRMVKLKFHQDTTTSRLAETVDVKFESRNPYLQTY